MAGIPALALLHVGPPPSSSPPHLAAAVSVSAGGAPDEAAARSVDNRVSRSETADLAVATPSTTASTTAPTTRPTARKAPVRSATTVARRSATPTTRLAPKPTSTAPKAAPKSGAAPSSSSAPAPSGRTETGGATWYDAAPPGTCAHKTLPKGTVVTITNLSTGATASCTVSDRGPYAEGMIIDLAKDVFTKLAPLSQGVIQVRINW
jgi:rare lipoprotein A (peptidoglycan hydrolase)